MKFEIDYIDFSLLGTNWYFKPAVKDAIQKEIEKDLRKATKKDFVPIPGVFLKDKEIKNGESKELHRETNANTIEGAKEESKKARKAPQSKTGGSRKGVSRPEDKISPKGDGEEQTK